MIKTIKIGEKEVSFSTAFAWAFIYKSQFGDDPMKTIVPAIKKVFSDPEIDGLPEGEEKDAAQAFALLESLGVVGIAQIAWSMAKLVDGAIPAPFVWIESFGDDFPVMDLIDELVAEAISSCLSTKKLEAPIPAEPMKTKKKQK